MERSSEHSRNQLSRRRFISNGVKITLLTGILTPLEQACNIRSDRTSNGTATVTKKKKEPGKLNAKRKRSIHEGLLVNTKTNVAHLPTASVYVYYDEMKHTKK